MVTGEKRICNDISDIKNVTAVVVDIEGTTTSISFVKETLFPYVREHLQGYLDAHWDEEKTKEDVKLLKDQAQKDVDGKIDGAVAIVEGEEEKNSVIKNVLWQMDEDKKTTALKQLQGHIWKQGYENGTLKGHVYSDVPAALRKWVDGGKKLYVYSSGSVDAQKLLFGNTEEGSLLSLFSNYFDTGVGAKGEKESYINIAKAVEAKVDEMLFLTDVVKEAEAARAAGLHAVVVEREGNAALTDEERKAFTVIKTFEEIVFETATKKQKLEEKEEEVPKPATNGSDEHKMDVDEKKTESAKTENGAKEEKIEVDGKESSEKPEAKKTEEAIAETSKEDVMEAVKEPTEEKMEAVNEAKPESVKEAEQEPTVEDKKAETVMEKKDEAVVKEEAEKKSEAAVEPVETPKEKEEAKTEDAAASVVKEAKEETDNAMNEKMENGKVEEKESKANQNGSAGDAKPAVNGEVNGKHENGVESKDKIVVKDDDVSTTVSESKKEEEVITTKKVVAEDSVSTTTTTPEA